MAILELKNVSYVYGLKGVHPVQALNHVSLTLDNRGITGLIGQTGSGKSTLVQLLNGILKPTEGQVLLDGKDIWEDPKKIRDVRFRVGLVMQYPEYQLFDETVRDDIAFGPKNQGVPEEQLETIVKESAAFAGLDESLLDKSPFDISGGQKRRAALAGVIAMRPDILVLDEPAAGLDPGGRKQILGSIRNYQKETGCAVIIVSHSMEDMANYCDRLLVISHGEIWMDGSCADVFARSEELMAQGLDAPEITKLTLALKERGVDIGRDVYTVNTAVERLLKYWKK